MEANQIDAQPPLTERNAHPRIFEKFGRTNLTLIPADGKRVARKGSRKLIMIAFLVLVLRSSVCLVQRRIPWEGAVLLLIASLSQAAANSSVTLAWSPPSAASEIAGYRVYYGTSSGSYSQNVNVGGATTVTLSNLAAQRTYFVVVTAYNNIGLESIPSNQVAVTAAVNPATNFISYSGDFNANGKQDILWRNAQTGEVRIWYMDGARVVSNDYVSTVSLNWKIVAVADFNGDGFSDILWVNEADGSFAVWLMHGDAAASHQFPSPGFQWAITGVADLDHSGMADILWRNLVTGEVRVWRSTTPLNFSSESLGVVTLDWQLVGAADLDGDGHPELVWWNQSSSEVRAWKLSGATITTNASLGVASPGWQVAGFGDFTGQGREDILWQNGTQGMVAAWIMNGFDIKAQWVVAGVSPAWQIRATPDLNGNHVNSILWSNSATGQQSIWASNGSSLVPAAPFASAGQVWAAQPGF